MDKYTQISTYVDADTGKKHLVRVDIVPADPEQRGFEGAPVYATFTFQGIPKVRMRYASMYDALEEMNANVRELLGVDRPPEGAEEE